MNWITTMVWSVTHSQTFWSVKSNGPYEALWSIKLVNAMALQIAVKRREAKGKGEKERYTHLKEIRKLSSVISAKKQRKTTEWERLQISSRKSEIPKQHVMQRWAQ